MYTCRDTRELNQLASQRIDDRTQLIQCEYMKNLCQVSRILFRIRKEGVFNCGFLTVPNVDYSSFIKYGVLVDHINEIVRKNLKIRKSHLVSQQIKVWALVGSC